MQKAKEIIARINYRPILLFTMTFFAVFTIITISFPYKKPIPKKSTVSDFHTKDSKVLSPDNEIGIIARPVNKHWHFGGILIKTIIASITGIIIASCYFRYSSIYCTIISSAAVGFLFFITLFGNRIISPTYIDWLLMKSDPATHFLGWHFFRNEPWHFPLGKLVTYNAPVGTSIGHTDSIPIMALLFKPFTSILPVTFQYFGIWLSLSFCLQGIFGALLVRTLSNNLIVQLLGALFFIFTPPLLRITTHAALSSHWALLAGLWLSFKKNHNNSCNTLFCSWVILIILIATIHVYLAVMTLCLAFAYYIRISLIDRSIKTTHGLLCISGLIASLFLTWWLIGYFGIGKIANYTAGDFAYHSMNLNSFVNPMGWSSFLKDWQLARKGQATGLAYLGIGLMILGLWAMYDFIKQPTTFRTIKSFLPLAAISLFFILIAVSNKITFGDQLLIQYEPPPQVQILCSIFRATGRFVWPVYYFMIYLIIAFIIRRNKPKVIIITFVIGLTLQFADFRKKYDDFTYFKEKQEWHSPLKDNFWTSIEEHYDNIIVVPPSRQSLGLAYIPFSYLASTHGMSINISYSARSNLDAKKLYTNRLIADIKEGKIDPESVYVVDKKYLELFPIPQNKSITCKTIDGFNVCLFAK